MTKFIINSLIVLMSISTIHGQESEYGSGTCGVQFGSRSCDSNNCCGKYGYCGIGSNYCGEGCQSGFGKNCNRTESIYSNQTASTYPQNTTESLPIHTQPSPSGKPPTFSLPIPVFGSYRSSFQIANFLQDALTGSDIPIQLPNSTIAPGTVLTKCQHPRHIALTFDDGPSPITSEILAILKINDVRATFFVVGSAVQTYTDPADENNVLRASFRDGHQIAGHSWSHPSFLTLGEEAMRSEITKTNEIIKDHIGVVPRYMRLPYGDGKDNQAVIDVAKDLGMVLAQWNFDSYDYLEGDVVQKYRVFLDQKQPAPESIIALNHDIQTRARDSLAQVITLLKNAGFQFVTLTECVGDSGNGYF